MCSIILIKESFFKRTVKRGLFLGANMYTRKVCFSWNIIYAYFLSPMQAGIEDCAIVAPRSSILLSALMDKGMTRWFLLAGKYSSPFNNFR